MTTDLSRESAQEDDQHAALMTEVEGLLEEVSDVDAAESVEPMAQITALLNSALDVAQERL